MCKIADRRFIMATNLALDDSLIEEAVKLGKHKTKKAAVTTALEQYVKSIKRLGILDMFGKVDFDPAWDYKTARRRSNKRIPKS
jgi:Arc/MetJ family transcription regulator